MAAAFELADEHRVGPLVARGVKLGVKVARPLRHAAVQLIQHIHEDPGVDLRVHILEFNAESLLERHREFAEEPPARGAEIPRRIIRRLRQPEPEKVRRGRFHRGLRAIQ